MVPSSVTLLGTGYTGTALSELLVSAGSSVTSTYRPGSLRPAAVKASVAFDLADPSTWSSIPASDATVWVFPAEPPERVRIFLSQVADRLGRIVAIGSSSSYLQAGPDELVSESNAPDLRQPRVQGENILMAAHALVLRSAGIYGPALGPHRARNPLDWLRSGRIASPERFVNLIHVQDLAQCILSALVSSDTAEDFIVSDGTPRRWKEIEGWARGQGFIQDVHYAVETPGRPSRRLSNEKLLRRLAPVLNHRSLFDELVLLEGGVA